MPNQTLTTGATFTPGKYNQDDVLNIARLAWQLSGNAEQQKAAYGTDSIDAFSGNRTSFMKIAQEYLNGVTTRVPQLDIALDKAVQQHFGSKTVAPATGAGGELRENITLPSGQVISTQDPNYDIYKKQQDSEARLIQEDIAKQQSKQSPEQIAQSTRDFLRSIGVSDDLINSLAPNQLNTFAMMQQVMQKKAENDQKLAPKDLTLDEMNKYLEDAKTELDPYYKEQFDFAKQDLLQNIAFQTGQLQDLEAMQATQFQQQQEQLGWEKAEAGTAQSGIRLEAEKRLREQQQGIVRSQRRQLGQNIYGLGSELERTFGSQKAASLYPTLTSQAQAGLPEQQLGYSPLGGRMGSLGKEQEIANRQRQQQLALEALQKRQLLAGQ